MTREQYVFVYVGLVVLLPGMNVHFLLVLTRPVTCTLSQEVSTLCVNHSNNIWYILTYLISYLLTPWCRIFFEKLIVTQLLKQYPASFMESEGSLPCSQKPATGPYSEATESSSPHRSLSP
jgi:hypothetical protein